MKEDAASDIGIMDVERHRKLKERNFRRRDAFSQHSIRFRAVGSYHCCCWFQQIQDWILVGMFLVQSFGVMVWITGQEVRQRSLSFDQQLVVGLLSCTSAVFDIKHLHNVHPCFHCI